MVGALSATVCGFLLAAAALRARRSSRSGDRALLAVGARLRRELAAAHEQVEWRGFVEAGSRAVLRVDGQETAVPLHEVARQLEAFPDCLPRVAERLVAELRRAALDRLVLHPYLHVARSLMPQLRTREWIERHGGRFGDAAIACRSFAADLVLCTVVDSGEALTFVTHGHLRAWRRPLDVVERLALDNARRRLGGVDPSPWSARAAVCFEHGDGYAAARLALLDLGRLEGRLCAMPDRDRLWIGAADAPAAGELARIAARTAVAFAKARRPLSASLYRIEQGGLRVVARGDQRGRPRSTIGCAAGTSSVTGASTAKPSSRSS